MVRSNEMENTCNDPFADNLLGKYIGASLTVEN